MLLAKLHGAEVTAIDHGDKLGRIRSLGANHLIDYTREDFSERAGAYDVIINMVLKYPYVRAVRALAPGGRYLFTNPDGLLQLLRAVWTSWTSRKKVIFEFAKETTESLDRPRGLIEDGKLRSIVDRTYPLEEVAEAHRYVESGRKLGNVVLTTTAEGAC